MTTTTDLANNDQTTTAATRPLDQRISAIGDQALRWSVIIVLTWIGAMKFTAYEAGAIEGLVASSPLMAWLYNVLSVQATSNLIGVVEIAAAIALVLAPIHRKIALAGALASVVIFAVTLSFLLTAPVWEASLGGFPALSVVPGQFLIKDIVLLAAAVSLLGKALKA